MPTLRAITNGPDEELSGKEVDIRNGKIDRCPGCGTSEIPVVENKEFGLTFIGYHNIEARCGGAISRCDYGGEVLRYLPQSQFREEVLQ